MQPLTQSNIFGISYWNASNFLWRSKTILIHSFKPKTNTRGIQTQDNSHHNKLRDADKNPDGCHYFLFFSLSLSPSHWLKGGNLQVLIPAAGPVNRTFWMKSVCPDTLGTLLAGWGVMNHLHSDRRVLKSRALNGRFKPNTHSHLQRCIHHFFDYSYYLQTCNWTFFSFFLNLLIHDSPDTTLVPDNAALNVTKLNNKSMD